MRFLPRCIFRIAQNTSLKTLSFLFPFLSRWRSKWNDIMLVPTKSPPNHKHFLKGFTVEWVNFNSVKNLELKIQFNFATRSSISFKWCAQVEPVAFLENHVPSRKYRFLHLSQMTSNCFIFRMICTKWSGQNEISFNEFCRCEEGNRKRKWL